MLLKRRKFRHIFLAQRDVLLAAHGEFHGTSADCANVQIAAVFYVQDDRVPAWIGGILDKVCTPSLVVITLVSLQS
jgi:hypothetical protein